MTERLPLEVRRIIAGPIESIEHLELLLLLLRTEPRTWSAEEAAAELRFELEPTAARLHHLVKAGLVTMTHDAGAHPCYALAAMKKSLREDVELLLHMYNTRPVSLVRAVYDRRSLVTQTFADAFRIRKEEP